LSSMDSQERLSGRRAQARRNDPLIRQAAREVFTTRPEAPMSAVAARAGVGISALYRRYASKEDLLRQVARDGLQQYLDEAEAAVADDLDPWTAFADFMARLLDAQTVAITMNLAGTFAPNEELIAMSQRAAELNDAIVERTKASGGLRSDVVVDDLSLILEQVSSIRLGEGPRTRELRRRYLALFLDGLRSPSAGSLPGPPPAPDELASRWSRGTTK
jgi:AcrR family transcriptional regulator